MTEEPRAGRGPDGIDRRTFLRASLGAAAVVPLVSRAAGATAAAAAAGAPPTGIWVAGAGPYGAIEGREPDENGLLLPEGFRSRLIGRGGEPVAGSGYRWHPFPDGGACFRVGGGWVYVSNSEVDLEGRGSVGAVRFDRAGRIVDAYPILTGTRMNCSGGAMPWGTWLSCEEWERGRVWECDPAGRSLAVARPALGVFRHEGAVADPATRAVYMTEDEPDGLLYRFLPDRWPDLSGGTLEAAAVDGDGRVRWVPVPDPLAVDGPARRTPGATTFPSGEGILATDGLLFFSTKGDASVRTIDLRASRLTTLWSGGAPLAGPDNLAVAPGSGDLFVCQDSDTVELTMVSTEGLVAPFARFVGHDGSEVTGVAFHPDGTRLYFSSQRAPTAARLRDVEPGTDDDRTIGMTVEVTGPFRSPPPAPAPEPEGDDIPLVPVGAAVGTAALLVGGLIALRRRGERRAAAP